jgi:hypothetical protein
MDYTDTHWGPRDKANARCIECHRTRQEVLALDVHHNSYDRGEDLNPAPLGQVCRRCHFLGKHDRDAALLRDESAFGPDQPRTIHPPAPDDLSPGP